MALENTMTEQDMDGTARKFVQGLRNEGGDWEPDLAVDGLSESFVAKIFKILTFRRS